MSRSEKRRLSPAVEAIVAHEGLMPNQTPFRITSPQMRAWTSMFDSTIRAPLDPNYPKPKGRENFLFVPEGQGGEVPYMVQEQFGRYLQRNPEITLAEAIRVFDQSGAAGKEAYLKGKGYFGEKKLREYL